MSRVPSNPAYHAGGHNQHPHQHPHPHHQQHPAHSMQYQHPHSHPQHAPHHAGAPPPSAPVYYTSRPSDHPMTSPTHLPPTANPASYPPISAHGGHAHAQGPGPGYDGQYGYRHDEWGPPSASGSGGHSAPGSATAPSAHAYPPHGHASSSRHPDPYSYSQHNASLGGPSHPPPPPGANGHAPPATAGGTSSARMSSPNGRPATSSAPRQPPGSTGWTSVHPHQPSQKGGRSSSGPGPGPTGGERVKMEELVSSDPPRSAGRQTAAKTSNAPSTVPGGPGPAAAPLLTGNHIPPGLPPAIAALHAPGGPFDPATNPAPTQQPGPSEFIKKLYKMLEEESAMYGGGESSKPRPKGAKRGSVGWGRGGTTFVVWDMNDFTTKILPQTFRHSNFSSFVRQLNKYGFSKIKHVDEDSGQMKENIWEFQHPNFQAGGKADLDSIKRKATVSKKDVEAMDPPSPGRVHPLNSHNSSLSNDDAMRFIHMEERLRLMEIDMISMGDELKEARNREVGMLGLMREMIGQIGQLEQATAHTPRSTDDSPSQRIVYLYQMLDQLSGSMHPGHGYGYGPSGMRPAHPYHPSHPSHPHASMPPRHAQQPSMPPPLQHQHSYTMQQPPSALVSARTSDGSGSNNNPSPASNQSHSARMGVSQSQQQQQPSALPAASAGTTSQGLVQPSADHQPQYGAAMETTASNTGTAAPAPSATDMPQHPTFADTGAWLTENIDMPMPVYHRKSSDGQALRFMMDILTQHGNVNGASQEQGAGAGTGTDGRFTDTQDPLDTTARQSAMSQAPGLQVNYPIVQSSPFGTLLIPAESGIHPNALANAAINMGNGVSGYGNDSAGLMGGSGNGAVSGSSATLSEIVSNGTHAAPGLANGSASSSVSLPGTDAEPPTFGQRSTTDAQGNANRLRRSTVIKPSWNKTPRILVVEDDVVYRQLSSKFLEKFGCVVETVVNASEAIEKMNSTKYDLVLMDIFFGPSMDGRKATSLIRQFDMYTPIISMTSNAQPKDVDSYLQSGMNDILAKPFTKNGLFGILDKHLIHLKAIQLSGEVPRSVGVPPLSAEGFMDAMITSANMQLNWTNGAVTGSMDDSDGEGQLVDLRNPLGGMGMSDDTYQILLHQFIQNGALPEGTNMQFTPYGSTPMPAPSAMITTTPMNGTSNGVGVGVGVGGGAGGAIGTNLVFGNANRKRSLEMLDDDWSPTPGTTDTTPVLQQGAQVGMSLPVSVSPMGAGKGDGSGKGGTGKEVKKAKKA